MLSSSGCAKGKFKPNRNKHHYCKFNTSGTTSAAQSPGPKQPPLVSKLKATSVLDDMVQYAIDSIEKAKYLGAGKKGKTATEGSNFYIFKFRAKNDDKEPHKIITSDFVIETADGPRYSPSNNGKSAVLLNGGSEALFENTLAPGSTGDFLVIFDMPDRYVETGASLVIPTTKASSNDRWVFRLEHKYGK